MEDESIINVEIHYQNKRFDFSQDNCINLSEIIEIIRNEINFQDKKDLQIYHIDDNQKVIKQILNDEDLQSCKKEISENKYLIKLKVNIEPESQKNIYNILSKSNYSILQSKIENNDKNCCAPFPIKQSVFAEKNEEYLKEMNNKENYIDNKVFEEKLKLLESNHLKEMQSLNEKIKEMDKNINVLKIIIFQFSKSIKNFNKKIEENIENKIKNNLDNYKNNMNSKINEIKNELNEQATKYINEQINKLLPKAKNLNDNKVCNINQIKIIKNIDNNMIDQNKKIKDNLPNKKNIIAVGEKKNENLEENQKNVKEENLKNDKINYRLKRTNIALRRYKNNNTINEEQIDRKIEDKKEINNNDSLKEEKSGFQDNSKNIINDNQSNKRNYYRYRFRRLNNQNSNFNGSIKKIEDDNSNFLTFTSQNIQISKKRQNKNYSIMNKIFFLDFQQKNTRFEKIKDFELEQIKKELKKDLNEGIFTLKEYCQCFIEENVLPIFKKSKLNNDQFETLKYNIEKILECCGLPKNNYSDDIFQQKIKKHIVDRNKSIEVMRQFRREFGIPEKEFSDEGIIKRLEENGLDKNKTFQKMFG